MKRSIGWQGWLVAIFMGVGLGAAQAQDLEFGPYQLEGEFAYETTTISGVDDTFIGLRGRWYPWEVAESEYPLVERAFAGRASHVDVMLGLEDVDFGGGTSGDGFIYGLGGRFAQPEFPRTIGLLFAKGELGFPGADVDVQTLEF